MPIFTELVPNYLSQDESLKFIENKKPLFKIRLNLVSTLYSTDKHLNNFYDIYENPTGPNFNKGLAGITKAKPRNIIPFLPVLLNQLFKLMCCRKDEESLQIFIAMNRMLHKYVFLTLKCLQNSNVNP